MGVKELKAAFDIIKYPQITEIVALNLFIMMHKGQKLFDTIEIHNDGLKNNIRSWVDEVMRRGAFQKDKLHVILPKLFYPSGTWKTLKPVSFKNDAQNMFSVRAKLTNTITKSLHDLSTDNSDDVNVYTAEKVLFVVSTPIQNHPQKKRRKKF
eukprot:Nk52_evm2s315 gene=Nk52_evmTU2s315